MWRCRLLVSLVCPRRASPVKALSRGVSVCVERRSSALDKYKILSRYFQKFSKAGKLAWEESTLGVETVEEEAQECDEE